MPLTTPLMSNFRRSAIGGTLSFRPNMLLRSIAFGLCQCRGPVTLGVVSGGTGVAAAAGLGAGVGLTATTGQAAAAGERACGKVARRLATALAAEGGHAD